VDERENISFLLRVHVAFCFKKYPYEWRIICRVKYAFDLIHLQENSKDKIHLILHEELHNRLHKNIIQGSEI